MYKVLSYDEFINEELLTDEESDRAIYKNPKSVRRLGPWSRGLTDKDGNFYVMENKNPSDIHEHLARWLIEIGELSWKNKGEDTFYEELMNNTVLWQQIGNENLFYLSESYGSEEIKGKYNIGRWENHIKKLTKKAKKRQSKFKFVEKRIWAVWESPDSLKDLKSLSPRKINEELIGDMGPKTQVFLNPKSIRNISSWSRAITTDDGDFWILHDETFDFTHSDIAEWMDEDTHSFIYLMSNFILWHRAGGSNTFYLSESYSSGEIRQFKKKIDNHISLMKKRYPKFEFIKESIWDIFNEPEWKDINKKMKGASLEIFKK